MVQILLPLIGCVTLASHGTFLSLREDNKVKQGRDTESPSTCWDSLGWGSLMVRCGPSKEWQDNVTGGTGTGAGWLCSFQNNGRKGGWGEAPSD